MKKSTRTRDAVVRIVTPAAIRVYAWRGDPVARLVRPQTAVDPYPLWADLRRQSVCRSALGPWVTARHATATSVLRDRRFSSSPVHAKGYRPLGYPPGDPRRALPAIDLLTMDPPDHTRIRRLVSRTFSPKAIAGLEPWIGELTDRLLASVDARAGFDLIDALAFPLSIAVICRLLGVPGEDRDRFREWGHEVAGLLDPQSTDSLERQPRTAELALTAYLRERVQQLRGEPDESLLSALVAAEEEGERLSAEELVSTAVVLLIAGFETTVNLIGNGTVALLRAPEQWARLREEPALVPAAVHELLRYDSPVQATSRVATEDVELDGTLIEAGSSVIVALGGANRDAAVFDEPDHLHIDRPNADQNLSFSYGIHRCLGSALARLEAGIALERLIARHPGLELAGAPAPGSRLVLRGFERVPVHAL
jgi:cytochrome P450